MAYSILSVTRLNNKELTIAVEDGVSIPKGTDIIFIDSSASNDWSSIDSPSDLPNATKYFTKVKLSLSSTNSYVIRDIPYRVGSHTLFIRHEGTWFKLLSVILTAITNPFPFPGTLNRATTKQKLPLLKQNDIKGDKIFTDIFDLLYLEKEDMTLGMKCTVWLAQENKIKTYALNPNYPIATIPYPLQDEPYDINEPRPSDLFSFRKYWYLDSVAEPELQPVAKIQYAPEFNGGIPPYFQGYISDSVKSNGYIFPSGSEWDDERAFTDTKWTDNKINLGADRSFYKRFNKTINGNYSIPLRIDQVTSGYLANRFARRFQFPQELGNQGTLVDFRIRTFYEGESNVLAEYSVDGVGYSFTDKPPAKRTWEQLTVEERTKYITYYNLTYSNSSGYQILTALNVDTLPSLVVNGVSTTVRQLVEKDNNALWVVYAQMDDFSNLESPWTDIQIFLEDNPALVRFNSKETTGEDGINEIRKRIDIKVNSLGGVESAYYQDYIDVGYVKDYNFAIHNYVATRASVSEPWIVQKIGGESGEYQDIVYKEYPINYYDRLNNTRTKLNYIPVGNRGLKNSQDDIAGDPVSTAFQAKVGFELYFSVMKKNFQGNNILDTWSPWIRSSARPAVIDDIVASTDSFKSTEVTTGSAVVITRENQSLFLEAKLFLEQNEIIEGTIYQEANVAESIVERREEIRYTWKRLFNNGNAENLVILDQSPSRLYYGYKNQTDFNDYFVVGNEAAEITPSNQNTGFKLVYTSDGNDGFVVFNIGTNANTALRRIALTSNSEGYKRDGILYDSSDSVVSSYIWVTDDLSKLANPTWADFVAYEFDYSYDYTTKLLNLTSSQRASFLREVTFTENGVESTVIPFTLSQDGKILTVHHAGVDGKTIFEVTQWRKVVDNADFAGVDEDFISYKSEEVIIDLVDRVKRAVSILPDQSALIAKSNFTTYTESEFIGKKSISISVFLENLPVGSWYVFKHDTYNFLDAEQGTGAFSGIDFQDVLEDNTYWTDLALATQSYNVTFADFIAGDNTLIPYKTYKYQTAIAGVTYLDFVSLSVNFAGQSARDIRISPDTFIIPLNVAGNAFEGQTVATFNTSSENVSNPFYEWKLINKAGTVIKTVVGNATNYPANIQSQFIVNFATDTVLGANETARIAYIIANSPFRVTVKDLVVNQNSFVDQAIINFVQGGIVGLKGEDGVSGINIIYNNTDLIPSENDGTVGTVSEDTKILVYRGVEVQPIGTGVGEFNVSLIDARDSAGVVLATISASNVISGGGVLVKVTGSDTIAVTAVPNNKDLVNVRFKIREGFTAIQNNANADVIFEYKLKKAKAGKPAWNFYLANQFQSLNLSPTALPLTGIISISGNSYYVMSSTSFDIIEGASNRNTELRSTIRPLLTPNAVATVLNLTGLLFNYYPINSNHGIAIGQTVNTILGLTRVGQIINRVFGILLPANTELSSPRIETTLTTVLIPAGKKPNQYRLSATNNYFEVGSPSITVNLDIIQNDPQEIIQTVSNWRINNKTIHQYNAVSSGGITNASLHVSNNNLIQNEPILSISVDIRVVILGISYLFKEYFEIINKTSQRLIIPIYGGLRGTTGDILNYTKQNNYSFENPQVFIDFNANVRNNFVSLSNAIQIKRKVDGAILTDGGVVAFANGVYRNGFDFVNNLGVPITNAFWFSFRADTNSPLSPPKVQAWAVEQTDGTMKIGDFFPISGQAGIRGRTYLYKEVYIEVNEGAPTPTKPSNKTVFSQASINTGENSSSGVWTTSIPVTQGKILYKTSILLEKNAPDSQFEYRYAEGSFSNVTRITGIGGAEIVRAYGIATVGVNARQIDAIPVGYTTNLNNLDSASVVYVIEKYVDGLGDSIRRFDLAGNYSNTGTYFWSRRALHRKDGSSGSNGTSGRGITDARINNGDLELLYNQSPNNITYQNLGKVVGAGVQAFKAVSFHFPFNTSSGWTLRSASGTYTNNASANIGDIFYYDNLVYPFDSGPSGGRTKYNKTTILFKVIGRDSTKLFFEKLLEIPKQVKKIKNLNEVVRNDLGFNDAVTNVAQDVRLHNNQTDGFQRNDNQIGHVSIKATVGVRRDSGGDDVVRLEIRKKRVGDPRIVIAAMNFTLRDSSFHPLVLDAEDIMAPGEMVDYTAVLTSTINSEFITDRNYPLRLSYILRN